MLYGTFHRCGILQRIVSDMTVYDDGRGIQLDLLDSYQLQLELTYHELIAMELLRGLLSDQQEPTLGLVKEVLSIVLREMIKIFREGARHLLLVRGQLAGRDLIPYIVGNFREGFIFAFFASQEPFAKIRV